MRSAGHGGWLYMGAGIPCLRESLDFSSARSCCDCPQKTRILHAFHHSPACTRCTLGHCLAILNRILWLLGHPLGTRACNRGKGCHSGQKICGFVICMKTSFLLYAFRATAAMDWAHTGCSDTMQHNCSPMRCLLVFCVRHVCDAQLLKELQSVCVCAKVLIPFMLKLRARVCVRVPPKDFQIMLKLRVSTGLHSCCRQ